MKLLIIFVISAFLNMGVLYADSVKVVYDLTTGDSNKIKKQLLGSAIIATIYTKE